MTVGVCTNLPSQCSKAASREPIPMPTPDVVCPECNSRLQPQKEGSGSSPLAPIMAIGAAVLALLAIVYFGMQMLGGHHGQKGGGLPFIASSGGDSGHYYLRLSGSNTIGSRLGPELVKAWLAKKGASDIQEVKRSGPGGAEVPEEVIKAQLDGKSIQVEVKAHGSADAFTDLASGAADVGMASRPIKDTEVSSLANLGDMRASASEHVLALDGIAVIVPQGNDISHLTLTQLQGLFSGQISDWSRVGGSANPVHIYARDDKSGTYDAFKTLVLRGAPLGQAKRYDDSATLEADVAHDSGAIGFIGMPYVQTTRAVPIADGSAAPLEPTIFTVKTEAYALSRRLFLYTAAQPTNPAVRDFVEFALSSDGQAVVKQEKFVDLSLAKSSAAPVAASASTGCRLSDRWRGDANDYCLLRSSTEQLQTSFRFRTGSSELDNRAISDLRRVLDRMSDSPDKTIVLAGFADSSGSYPANCALSKTRAEAIARAFSTLGLKITDVRGYCDELPVRDNGTDAGREQNRRVEIFLR